MDKIEAEVLKSQRDREVESQMKTKYGFNRDVLDESGWYADTPEVLAKVKACWGMLSDEERRHMCYVYGHPYGAFRIKNVVIENNKNEMKCIVKTKNQLAVELSFEGINKNDYENYYKQNVNTMDSLDRQVLSEMLQDMKHSSRID